MRPHIFMTETASPGLRSVEQVRQGLHEDAFLQSQWQRQLQRLAAIIAAPVYTPLTLVPNRDAGNAKIGNCDYVIISAVCNRIMDDAIAALLTGEMTYRDDAMAQLACVFDASIWPDYRDVSHRRLEADLRHGQLATAIGLAYDWLYPLLDTSQRKWIIDQIHHRIIDPIQRGIEAGNYWFDNINNWMTVVVGGLGIAAMAMDQDLPGAQSYLDQSLPRMEKYLNEIGPKGEFNESVAYGGSIINPVIFFLARRYHTLGRDQTLGSGPLGRFGHWYMRMTNPPGRVATLGDGHLKSKPMMAIYPALAQAGNDGVLQWFYRQHTQDSLGAFALPQLLWYDPTIEPTPPDGRVPLGDVMPANTGCFSSRSSWDQRDAACVVFGKAGKAIELHGHHDQGQVCIDVHGRNMIVDLGTPAGGYPADFFKFPNRFAYYNASVRGHSLIQIDDQETRHTKEAVTGYLMHAFDDRRGGMWAMDLTVMYEHAAKVHRRVVHLLPGVVAVLDEVTLDGSHDIHLRWHTANRCAPDDRGGFMVEDDGVRLAGMVNLLGPAAAGLTLERGEHAYHAPYDRNRIDVPLIQRRESFIHARVAAGSCAYLSLFGVVENGQAGWRRDDPRTWSIDTAEGTCRVTCDDTALLVTHPGAGISWHMPR